jgi:hypothetical protein
VIDDSEYSYYIARSRNSGTNSESISSTLGMGNYFVKVESASEGNNTNYTLRLVNQTSETVNISELSGTRTFNQFVGKNDPVDYYRFSLNNLKMVSLSLNNLSADADVYLYQDSNNNGIIDDNEYSYYIARSRNSGTNSESISSTLGMGNYFVKVESASEASNTNYTLRLVNQTSETVNIRLVVK